MLTQNLPKTFAESVRQVEEYALLQTQKAAAEQQLYYHNEEHVQAVKRRAKVIFEAIAPFLSITEASLERTQLLIDLCAIAHDMVQIFSANTSPHTPRKRPYGVSETETIVKLIAYIQNLNQQILQNDPGSDAVFMDSDLETIREAIEATVCDYDPGDRSIYQPLLYRPDNPPNTVALVLALADLGALGIEGIDAYNQEGSLIFLEENPDVAPIICRPESKQYLTNFETPDQAQKELYENIRQRLLKRSRFQVGLARGRLERFEREVASLPQGAIHELETCIFKHLNREMIEELEQITPTRDDTTLMELVEFFKLCEF